MSDIVVKNGYFLFWGNWPSQWYQSDFTVDGTKYNCCEQYMMAEKARLFDDKHILKQIMSTSSPKDQKKLGRKVKDFDDNKWNSVCRNIVYEGNLAKYSQNEELKNLLIATGRLTIVEASPYDKIWGIGLSTDDPDAVVPGKWRGKNWLGEAIMKVRNELKG